MLKELCWQLQFETLAGWTVRKCCSLAKWVAVVQSCQAGLQQGLHLASDSLAWATSWKLAVGLARLKLGSLLGSAVLKHGQVGRGFAKPCSIGALLGSLRPAVVSLAVAEFECWSFGRARMFNLATLALGSAVLKHGLQICNAAVGALCSLLQILAVLKVPALAVLEACSETLAGWQSGSGLTRLAVKLGFGAATLAEGCVLQSLAVLEL